MSTLIDEGLLSPLLFPELELFECNCSCCCWSIWWCCSSSWLSVCWWSRVVWCPEETGVIFWMKLFMFCRPLTVDDGRWKSTPTTRKIISAKMTWERGVREYQMVIDHWLEKWQYEWKLKVFFTLEWTHLERQFREETRLKQYQDCCDWKAMILQAWVERRVSLNLLFLKLWPWFGQQMKGSQETALTILDSPFTKLLMTMSVYLMKLSKW